MKRTLMAAGLAILASSCATSPDYDDTTPPTLELKYRFEGGRWAKVPSAGKSIGFDSGTLYLWAVGQDSGGVERVTIKATGDVICSQGSAKYDHETSVKEVSQEDDGGRTVSSRNVLMTFPGGRACEADADTFRSGTLEFVATARNFAGAEVTSGTLTATRD